MNCEALKYRGRGPGFDARIVLVGQAPGKGKYEPRLACTGAFMQRLVSVSGLNKWTLYRIFERHNLLDKYPGGSSSGDKFPKEEAVAAAIEMEEYLGGKSVVFAGCRVPRAFGLEVFEFFLWADAVTDNTGERFRYVTMPHPSGVSHWWNNVGHRQVAKDFLQSLVKLYHDQQEELRCQQSQAT